MINWKELPHKFPNCFEQFSTFVRDKHGDDIVWHLLGNTELYAFFDQKGLILLIDYEHLPVIPHFRATIYDIKAKKLHVLQTWFSNRTEAESEGFKQCFEILDVQLNE